MKWEGYLMEKIADPDKLRLSFWKVQRGKSAKEEVMDYQKGLDKNLLTLREELLAGAASVGNYHYFKVQDPKERQICAAAFSKRVLHHALMNVCHDTFEKYQIHYSYASCLHKGTYAALKRASAFQQHYRWFLKLDVRKYFDSIDLQILNRLLTKRFKDHRLLIVFSDIIHSYHTQPHQGVPIGNLTSQFFANHFLAVSDHFVKENLHLNAYVRYMDDMMLWGHDKAELNRKGNLLAEFIGATLGLKLKPFCLNYSSKGLPFLGDAVYPNTIRLSRNRFTKKLKQYENNLTTNV
jgi:hypothetical protein